MLEVGMHLKTKFMWLKNRKHALVIYFLYSDLNVFLMNIILSLFLI